MRSAGTAPKMLDELRSIKVKASEKMELLDGLRSIKVKSSEKVELSCQMYLGQPTADVKWYRNGKKISNNQKYKITRDGDTMSLIITESEETDSAIYRCEAVNKLDKVHTECDVVVLRTFRFSSAFLVIFNVAYFVRFIHCLDSYYYLELNAITGL